MPLSKFYQICLIFADYTILFELHANWLPNSNFCRSNAQLLSIIFIKMLSIFTAESHFLYTVRL